MESKELKGEHGDIQDRLDKLVDLMIEGRIADEDYQKKHRALKKQQIEIMNKLRSLDAVDGQFAKQMDYLIKVAHGSANIFAGSENSEKRELLKMIFQNLQLRGKKLEYTMASPFDEFAKCTEIAEWWCVFQIELLAISKIPCNTPFYREFLHFSREITIFSIYSAFKSELYSQSLPKFPKL